MEYDGRAQQQASDARQQAEQAAMKGSSLSVPAVFSYLGLGTTPFSPDTSEEELEAGLSHPDWRTRIAAAKELEQRGERAPIKPLIAALEDEHDAVRAAALRTLGKLGARAPIAPLVAALDDRSWHARAAAVTALGRQSTRTPIAPLIAALEDRDEAVRAAAAAALGALGERTPIAFLVSALHDNAWSVREAAVLALGVLIERTPLSPLLTARTDNDAMVREAVEQVLQQTHPELFVTDNTEIHTDELALDVQTILTSTSNEDSSPLQQQTDTVTLQSTIEEDQHIHYIWKNIDGQSNNKKRISVFAVHTKRRRRTEVSTPSRLARITHVVRMGLVALLLLGIGLGTFFTLSLLHHTPSYTDPVAQRYMIYQGHAGEVFKVAWSPDGMSLIASVGADGTVQIWDAETGYLAQPPNHVDFSKVLALSWTHSGLLLAYVGQDGTTIWIKNLTMQSKQPFMLGQAVKNTNPLVAFSSDGKYLALSLHQNKSSVQVWDIAAQREIHTFLPYVAQQNSITAIAWEPASEDTRIVIATDDGNSIGERQILMWDTTGKQVLNTGFTQNRTVPFNVFAMSWSPNGSALVLATEDGTLYLHSPTTQGNMPLNPGAKPSSQIALAWSPDGQSLAASTSTGLIEVWNMISGAKLYVYNGHTQPINNLAWSPDGKYVASASKDGTVQIWHKP